MPIRVELRESSRLLELPEGVERALRRLLQQPEPEHGRLTADSLEQIQRDIDVERRDAGADSNEESLGAVAENEILVDGDAVRRVVLDGLRRRLVHPVEDGERLLLTGRRP